MKKNSELRSISYVMIIMLVGKLLSLAANQVYLSYFGADNERLNIFSWALQIPNYIFQSMGTALASVVIPIFAALCANKKYKEANRFGSNIVTISTIFTLALVVLGMALSFVLPSFTDFSDKAYTAMALRIMMPVMLFYSLTYIYQGILQSLDNFVAPALVNLPNGIVIILYIIFFAKDFGVTGLLVAVLIGFFMQFAILVPPAKKAGFGYRPVLDLKDDNIRTAGKMMIPIILGASAYQFNMFFNNTMMTNVSPDSVSLFNFVQTLILSLVMTLVMAITSVMYPKLTAYAAKNDMEGFNNSLSATVRNTVYLLMPITVGLICLGKPVLTMISMHGKVTAANIETEYSFLFMYTLCIVFLGIKEIADRAFYSLKSTKISAVTGVVIMVTNVILGYIFSKYTPLGAAGIPLGYSIATTAGTVFLTVKLKMRTKGLTGIAPTVIKTLISSIIMGIAVYLWYILLSARLPEEIVVNRIVIVGSGVVIGMIIFFVMSYILKTQPIIDFLSNFKRRGAENE